MATTGKIRHAWLRDALTDRGFQQKDVAKRWKVDNAVVSRFIRVGEPELTFERADVLCDMLGMDLTELRMRLAEKPIPRRERERVEPNGDPSGILAELKACVNKARAALPGWKINLTIEPGNGDPGTHGNPMRVAFVAGEGH